MNTAKKILILDDDDTILDLLAMILVDEGYDVQALSTGEKVFEEIKAFVPDLILMDVMLAKMDGRKICRMIKQSEATKGLPIILISGTHDLADSLHQQGAPNDFLAKPFDVDHLLTKVNAQFPA